MPWYSITSKPPKGPFIIPGTEVYFFFFFPSSGGWVKIRVKRKLKLPHLPEVEYYSRGGGGIWQIGPSSVCMHESTRVDEGSKC